MCGLQRMSKIWIRGEMWGGSSQNLCLGDCVSKRTVGAEGGTSENFREVEFLLQNRSVSEQNRLGSKYHDEKRDLVFGAVRSYWNCCSLGVMSIFDGLGRLVWQWNIRWFKSPID